MDQLKTQLAVIKQHSFWAMCLGILGVTLGSWWYSTGALKAERDKQKSEIDGAISQVSGIQGTNPQHPNAATAEEMEKLRFAYAQQVREGWDLQYSRQENVLVWPENFTEGFRETVNKLRPIEEIPVTGAGTVPFSRDLAQAYKEEYRNFIDQELPKLAEIIGAQWRAVAATSTGTDASGMGGAMPGGLSGAMPGAMPGGGYSGDSGLGMTQTDAYGNPIGGDTSIVRWDPANQQEIVNTHYGFTSLTRLPTTLEILYAQEDFWVLTNLMNIIKATNGEEVTAHHEAAIKYLDFVRIGRSAAGLAGQITPLGMPAGGMMAGGMATDGSMPTGGGEPSMPGDPAAAAGGSPDGGTGMPGGDGYGVSTALLDPAEQRYVDEKYQPLTAARLRGALKSQAPEDAMLAVAKRMPVRLRVRIDQRRLNVLIAECGNSSLPVEVRQVRINRPPAAAGQMGMGGMASGDGYGGGGMPGGGFSGGMGSSDGGMGGGYGGGGGFGSGSSFGGGMPGSGMLSGDGYGGGGMGTGMRSVTQDASIDTNLIEVELYGIVYIYNPANKAQLGLEAPPAVSQDGTVPTEGTLPPDGTVPPEGTAPESTPPEGTPPADAVAPPAEATTPAPEGTPPAATPPATTPTGAEITGGQG